MINDYFQASNNRLRLLILLISVFLVGNVTGILVQKSVYFNKKARLSAYDHLLKYKFGWYHHYKVSTWEYFGKRGRVLFIGDSLTENGNWQDLFPSMKVVNQGIGGDTTQALMARLPSACRSGAEIAILTIGTNDFIKNIDEDKIYSNWEKIIFHLKRCNIEVISVSTPMTSLININDRITKYNERQNLACSKNNFCNHIDINRKLAKNGSLDERFTIDGIHLSIDGYQEWKELLTPHLERFATNHSLNKGAEP